MMRNTVAGRLRALGTRGVLVRMALHVLVAEDGRCVTESGGLAGSSLNMATAAHNAVQRIGVPKDEALRMASLYPAEYLGVADRIGRIAPGYEASFAVLDNEMYVDHVYFQGERV